MKYFNPLILFSALTLAPSALAGPFTYGVCQTGCNVVTVACYAAAGFTFGTVAAAGAPAVIVACNSALGTCSAGCAALLVTPTP
ncbi:uncharacterized protein EI90DRAFT_2906664 [Cantharellus anzutake]|uniref:uncharacterized protein n=1 Tax=Cantharellus anzutake TaxID=1750568 RepID=UPI00190634F3|nr:uncharacterized protein EI90DRAFT_2906664 [Cantharellus anzutake]KAF8340302.1 hypothetical protein EI90DRAFT_2906664 [Cantharellus anzutake]